MSSNHISRFAFAMAYLCMGVAAIPIARGTKQPPGGFALADYFRRLPTRDELRAWFDGNTDYQIATVHGTVSGTTALDFESLDEARTAYRRIPRKSPAICLTARGAHLIYRLKPGQTIRPRVKATIANVCGDVRSEGSYTLAPNAIHPDGSRYSWFGATDNNIIPWTLRELPYFDESWVEERRSGPLDAYDVDGDMVLRARAYMKRVEGAVSGNGGHDKTLYAAGVLVQRFGLTADQAWPLLLEYNERCQPPWTMCELRRKLSEALRNKK